MLSDANPHYLYLYETELLEITFCRNTNTKLYKEEYLFSAYNCNRNFSLVNFSERFRENRFIFFLND